jgi:hypothetical protein
MKFSKLAKLGDLNQYSLEELKLHLNDWEFESISLDAHLEVQWSCNHNSIKVLYNLTGEFIQILEERWKSSNEEMIFKRTWKV